MRADVARTTLGVDGTGVIVGILSDSFGCTFGGVPSDVATPRSAAVVLVHAGIPGCS